MTNTVIGVGGMAVGRVGDTLVTYALGSCLGLTLYDPETRVGGLLHALLPQSKINPEKARDNPAMFVNTGVPSLFLAVYELGGVKERLVVKAAGCGAPLGAGTMFNTGDRNYTVLKKILWKNNVLLDAEDVGGSKARTVTLDLTTGKVTISSGGERREL
ncbi:MAG: chemotaxis protein CheD [Candidatus Eisenbacteria bacterium]|uniref:Probable chemoreceptor glutamine deamidase CheD n=1 Tax=Eiseniibacteriota bacterium TaxID=2212470 RepID=A0A956LZA1_UNCEI|nr:chemotaxis protein CheD [Candidatus Eisenbacteria bacterium]